MKLLYGYFAELDSDNEPLNEIHPNYSDARTIIQAHYLLNDIVLGTLVGDEEIDKEVNELLMTLEDLSKGTGLKIPCAVLEDGTRVLRERSVARAIGRKGGGAYWQRKKMQNGALLPEYVSAKNLESFIDKETREMLLNPITFPLIFDNRLN